MMGSRRFCHFAGATLTTRSAGVVTAPSSAYPRTTYCPGRLKRAAVTALPSVTGDRSGANVTAAPTGPRNMIQLTRRNEGGGSAAPPAAVAAPLLAAGGRAGAGGLGKA